MNDMTPLKRPFEPASLAEIGVTLADLIRLVEADPGLAPQRQRDLASAIRSLCHHLGLDPALTPASRPYLRRHLSRLHPEQARVSLKTVQNLRSLVDFALRRYVAEDRRRGRQGLTPEWQALWDRLTEPDVRFGLSRFMRFCSDRAIAPEAVTEAHAAAFLDWLRNETFVKHPEKLHRRCLVLWNRAVATVPGWPASPLPVPDNRNAYTLKWEDLPEGLRRDAAAWLEHLAKDDPFSLDAPPRPAKPATIKQRRFQLRQLVSALALSGYDLCRLQSLRDLVEVETAKRALRFFWERQGGAKPNGQTGPLAATLFLIGKHRCRVDPEHLEALRALRRSLSSRDTGLTPKNRERLRQFTDHRNIEALLGLPQRILEAARRSKGVTLRDALDVQVAIALEMLLMMPIRRANLVTLRVGPEGHVMHPSTPGERAWVVVGGHEVKNAVDLEYPLPPETSALLEAYLERFQPRLAGGPSPWLFPGEGASGHKSLDQFSRQFSMTIRRWTGLAVNLHLMRHIGAKLFLDRNPGAYEVVRRVLGHRALSTTLDTYTGLETDSALRHYEAVILGIRAGISREVGDGW